MFQNSPFDGNMNNMNINPIAYQAFLNMMSMNPNFNPNNQINLNNMMMQYMMMNPGFFQMNNNPQNNFQNFNSMQPVNLGNLNAQNIIQNGGVMPRANNNNKSLPYVDSFPGYTGNRINVIFETGTGLLINIAAPVNVTVEELFIKFANRVGVGHSLLGKKIFFIANGAAIKADEKKLVGEIFKDFTNNLKEQMKIIVLDASNVIGAYNYIYSFKLY